MRIAEGDNHVISERDGLVICQVWERPDLSAEQGANNAAQIVAFVMNRVLRVGTACRGLVFDLRRGPPTFGPKTRTVMTMVFARAGAVGVPIAVLTGPAKQKAQYSELCQSAPGDAETFGTEAEAVRWVTSARKPKGGAQAGRR